MNKQQRTIITAAQTALADKASAVSNAVGNEEGKETITTALQALVSELEDTESIYNDIGGEEQEKFDNLSEGLQQSERGQQYESNASTFEDAASEAASLRDDIEKFLEKNANIAWNDELADEAAAFADSAERIAGVEEA